MLSLASDRDPVLGLFGLSFNWNTREVIAISYWEQNYELSTDIRGRGESSQYMLPLVNEPLWASCKL